MDIIIHGKPVDTSERCTAGINKTLAQDIISGFFGYTAKESEELIVDVRNWDGTWVSVYTLFLSQNVIGKDNRSTYFAISLILPHRYCCVISEVYHLLEQVVREQVLGVYLNNNLKYIVSNFEDTAAFDRLCSKLQASYVNLEKDFDRSFRPQTIFSNDNYCSIYDCDSLAFVNLLKNKGRVIVTENAQTKDALAAQSAQFYQEAQLAKAELSSKTAKIAELEEKNSQLEEAGRKESQTKKNKVKELEGQIKTLQAENQKVSNRLSESQQALKDFRGNVAEAIQSINLPNQKTIEQMDEGVTPASKKTTSFSVVEYLPAVNTLLIMGVLVVLFLMIFMGKSFGKAEQQGNDSEAALVDSLNDELDHKDFEIAALRESNEKLVQTLEQYKADLDNTMNLLQEKSKQFSTLNSASQISPQVKAGQKTDTKKDSKKDSKTDSRKESVSETNNTQKETKQ